MLWPLLAETEALRWTSVLTPAFILYRLAVWPRLLEGMDVTQLEDALGDVGADGLRLVDGRVDAVRLLVRLLVALLPGGKCEEGVQALDQLSFVRHPTWLGLESELRSFTTLAKILDQLKLSEKFDK